ncbi:MAG: type II secretion system F family protein [Acidimicrobiales bacterium]
MTAAIAAGWGLVVVWGLVILRRRRPTSAGTPAGGLDSYDGDTGSGRSKRGSSKRGSSRRGSSRRGISRRGISRGLAMMSPAGSHSKGSAVTSCNLADVRHRARDRLAARLGLSILALFGYRPDPQAAQRLGATVLAAAVGLALAPWLTLACPILFAAVAWAAPRARAGRRLAATRRQVVAGLAEVVDLLALATGSGLTVWLAVQAVGRRGQGPLAQALGQAAVAVARGRRLADALEDVADNQPDEVRPLIGILVSSERYGVPLGPALERLAAETRQDQRRRAEEAARRVPVKLLFPLVACTLPAFALLTMAPLIISAIASLRL